MSLIRFDVIQKWTKKLEKECTNGELYSIAENLIHKLIHEKQLKSQLGFHMLINSMMEVYQE